jgi:hypothetical protein
MVASYACGSFLFSIANACFGPKTICKGLTLDRCVFKAPWVENATVQESTVVRNSVTRSFRELVIFDRSCVVRNEGMDRGTVK